MIRLPAVNSRLTRRQVGGSAVLLLSALFLSLSVPLAGLTAGSAAAQTLTGPQSLTGGKLLATGGVTQLEGAAGGGLTPWAVIGGYGTRDQIGGNAFGTYVRSDDYELTVGGAIIGLYDRVELSIARQAFDTRDVGTALGIGEGFTFHQTILGAKVRLFGDAVLDQDSWIPQVAVGVQYKDNDRDGLLRAIGARDGNGTDYYLSATKIILEHSLLLNGTIRLTKANQLGILGFGGRDDEYEPMLEGSAGWLLSRNLLIGAEYRMKPDNLAIVKESDWFDVFVAWVPSKHVSVTLAYADLGTVAIRDNQRALYLSLQIGF